MTRQKYCNMIFLKSVDYVDMCNPAALVHRALLKKTVVTVFVKTHFFLFIMYSHAIQKCYFLPNLDNCIWIILRSSLLVLISLFLNIFTYFYKQSRWSSKHRVMDRKLNDNTGILDTIWPTTLKSCCWLIKAVC